MESTILGLILDSSVLIAAERNKRNAVEVVEIIQSSVGQVPIALSVVTIAEVAH